MFFNKFASCSLNTLKKNLHCIIQHAIYVTQVLDFVWGIVDVAILQWKLTIIGDNNEGSEKIKPYNCFFQNKLSSAIPCNDVIACSK